MFNWSRESPPAYQFQLSSKTPSMIISRRHIDDYCFSLMMTIPFNDSCPLWWWLPKFISMFVHVTTIIACLYTSSPLQMFAIIIFQNAAAGFFPSVEPLAIIMTSTCNRIGVKSWDVVTRKGGSPLNLDASAPQVSKNSIFIWWFCQSIRFFRKWLLNLLSVWCGSTTKRFFFKNLRVQGHHQFPYFRISL